MPLFDLHCPSCQWTAEDQWESGTPTPCAQCGTPTEHLWRPRKQGRAFVDEWPMGKTFDNGFPKPRTFYSRSEYHKALKENGFEVRGDGEEQFAWMSKKTLENAAALVGRATANRETVEPSEPIDISPREFLAAVARADEANR